MRNYIEKAKKTKKLHTYIYTLYIYIYIYNIPTYIHIHSQTYIPTYIPIYIYIHFSRKKPNLRLLTFCVSLIYPKEIMIYLH